jgi:hypothetical protein
LDDQQAVTQNCGGYTIVNTGGIGGTGGWTGGDDEDNDDPGSSGGNGNVPINIISDIYNNWVTLENQCAASTQTNFFNNTACLNHISVISQDAATAASAIGAFATGASTVIGCIAGAGATVLPGCAGGYAMGLWFHVNITNYVESGLNAISFTATIASDFSTDDNVIPRDFLDFAGYSFGEDTITATHTFIAGLITVEPFTDFAIDFYASGYNHGYFCGMSTILNCFGK